MRLTIIEKIEVWNDDRKERKRIYLTDWHPHFCWLPHRMSLGDWRWLETIYRIYRFDFQADKHPRVFYQTKEGLEEIQARSNQIFGIAK